MHQRNEGLYIGLMSGTSMDGIDAALVQINPQSVQLIQHHGHPYSTKVQGQLTELCNSSHYAIQELGELNRAVGNAFADAVHALLSTSPYQATDIVAIGSHGQTVHHHPDAQLSFSLQLGDPNSIAYKTQIATVADFRNKDIVAGGQGAPLAPRFHQHLLQSSQTHRVIINIGGIANITVLPKDKQVPCAGFDTGPGNTLLDVWIQKQQNKPFDQDGTWSKQGKLQPALLKRMMSDPYFSTPAPKSTGREYFNLAWLNQILNEFPEISPQDIQRTLVALTAQTLYQGIKSSGLTQGEAYICGGGAHNKVLMEEMKQCFEGFSVDTTQALGVDPDWMEAMAFAWLASRTMNQKPSNLPAVTGADRETVLGGIYYP